jgi:hypothetical protein
MEWFRKLLTSQSFRVGHFGRKGSHCDKLILRITRAELQAGVSKIHNAASTSIAVSNNEGKYQQLLCVLLLFCAAVL